MGKKKDGYLHIRIGRKLNDDLSDQARLLKTTKTNLVAQTIKKMLTIQKPKPILYTERVLDGLSDKVALKVYVGPSLVNQIRHLAKSSRITVSLLLIVALLQHN